MLNKPPRLAGPFSAIKKEGKVPPVLLELERSNDVEDTPVGLQVDATDQVEESDGLKMAVPVGSEMAFKL